MRKWCEARAFIVSGGLSYRCAGCFAWCSAAGQGILTLLRKVEPRWTQVLHWRCLERMSGVGLETAVQLSAAVVCNLGYLSAGVEQCCL